MREVLCPVCSGARLAPLPLAVTIDGHSIADICGMSIGDAAKTLAGLTLSELAIESFFPADAATARTLRRLGDGQTGAPAA